MDDTREKYIFCADMSTQMQKCVLYPNVTLL